MIMGMTTIVKHVFVFYPIVIQLAEDLLWRDAQLNTKRQAALWCASAQLFSVRAITPNNKEN
jgi:hypothetical protein